MSTFLNFYECYKCQHKWQDVYKCAAGDMCPECGAKSCEPYRSDDIDDKEEVKQVYLAVEMYHGTLSGIEVYDHEPPADKHSECSADGRCPECQEELKGATAYGCDSCGWGDYEWDDSTRLWGPIDVITDKVGENTDEYFCND